MQRKQDHIRMATEGSYQEHLQLSFRYCPTTLHHHAA